MLKDFSFDVVSEIDLQEVDNAINQAAKEMRSRFDFKGSKSDLAFNRDEKKITLIADDGVKLKNLHEMVRLKFAKRGVSVKAVRYNEAEKAFDGLLRQIGEIIQGIPQDKAKEIVKLIKSSKLKVQTSIQGDQIRVSGKSKDDLQAVISMLRAQVSDVPLQFVNYR